MPCPRVGVKEQGKDTCRITSCLPYTSPGLQEPYMLHIFLLFQEAHQEAHLDETNMNNYVEGGEAIVSDLLW